MQLHPFSRQHRSSSSGSRPRQDVACTVSLPCGQHARGKRSRRCISVHSAQAPQLCMTCLFPILKLRWLLQQPLVLMKQSNTGGRCGFTALQCSDGRVSKINMLNTCPHWCLHACKLCLCCADERNPTGAPPAGHCRRAHVACMRSSKNTARNTACTLLRRCKTFSASRSICTCGGHPRRVHAFSRGVWARLPPGACAGLSHEVPQLFKLCDLVTTLGSKQGMCRQQPQPAVCAVVMERCSGSKQWQN